MFAWIAKSRIQSTIVSVEIRRFDAMAFVNPHPDHKIGVELPMSEWVEFIHMLGHYFKLMEAFSSDGETRPAQSRLAALHEEIAIKYRQAVESHKQLMQSVHGDGKEQAIGQ